MSQTCQQNFTLTVGSCPDWTTLSWGVGFFIATAGTGVATFTPNGAGITDSFDATATNNIAPTDMATCRNGATLNYNGTGCNCVLNFTWLNTLPAGSSASITILGNFPGIIIDLFVTGSGVYAHPFTIPDTLGVPVAISISVLISAAAPGIGSGHVTGNIANV